MSFAEEGWSSRLMRNPAGLVALAIGLLVLVFNTVSVIPEGQQALILRLSKPDRTVNRYKPNERFGHTGAGLIVRIPFIEELIRIDKRVLDIDMDPQEVLSTDQLRVNVDAYARYRIVDPLRMYETVRSERQLTEALKPNLASQLRNELGKIPFSALLSAERGKVMDEIQAGLDRVARQYGAQIVDVRIKSADLPSGTPIESAFERMKSDRLREAQEIDADGGRQAQIIYGEADAQAAKIYAESFGKDAAFYDFYRAMQSYKKTFGPEAKKESNMILSPGNDYLRQFRGGN